MDKKEPKFCRKCGEKLLVRDGTAFYDQQTGNKVFIRHFNCPRKDIDSFLAENKIEKNERGTWDDLTEKQRELVDKFWEDSRGHTNSKIKIIVESK